jgi:hypothetical protein
MDITEACPPPDLRQIRDRAQSARNTEEAADG